jgi:hypothetical protein
LWRLLLLLLYYSATSAPPTASSYSSTGAAVVVLESIKRTDIVLGSTEPANYTGFSYSIYAASREIGRRYQKSQSAKALKSKLKF